ncbi:hypothetical protein [Actinoplanes sp. NPDC049599]|uniref:hypothetical protein n=1 Tax=Actinoplanes sp. NPDC049599 TaxID=3363903 RepID=UPI0037A4C239
MTLFRVMFMRGGMTMLAYPVWMVARKIVFYRWMSVNGRAPFVPHESAQKVADMIALDDYSGVLEGDDTTTALEVVKVGSGTNASHIRLMALRNPGNRPAQWELGNGLSSLQLLDDQYPADVTNVAIWPNGIAAQDLARDSPRLGRLSHFLRHRVAGAVSFEPLFRPDMYERMMRMRGRLRSVHIAMTKPEYLDKDRGVFGTLVPAIWGPKAPSINIQLGVGKYGPKDRYLDEETEETIFNIAEHASDYVDRLIVRGRDTQTNKIERISLLNERLQKAVDIPEDAKAAELPAVMEAFKEIEMAFREFEVQGAFASAIQAQMMHG